MKKTWFAVTLLIALCATPACRGQLYSNVLVNPGFESGATETNIDGWVRFNNAVRDTKPGTHEGSYVLVTWGNWWPAGQWNASGAYQEHPTTRGDIWEASVWALAETPVTGRQYAAINMEFYNTADQQIFTATSAARINEASPTGKWFQLKVKARATLGTAYVRVIPLLLQSPDFEGGTAWLDDCALCRVPTATVAFAGYDWIVNDGSSSPGENYYSSNCISVDSNGWLHMEVKQINGTWYCPFMETTGSLGFGEYRWYAGSRVDLLDTNLVAGLFTYAQEAVFNTNQNEVDIEFSRGLPGTQTNNLLFTVQPYTIPGNSYQHPMDLTNELTTHRFIWRPDRVDWQSYYGHTPEPPDTNHTIAAWRFESRGIPIETNERAYLNLWLFYTNQPADTQGLEMIIRDFAFVPFDGFLLADDFGDDAVSNIWSVVGSGVEETNGRLCVAPQGAQRAGIVTTSVVHRNERGCRYVFAAQMQSVSVTVARAGEDVRALMTLSAGTNDARAASVAAILQGRYDEADDTMVFAFFTKTNAPGSDGTLRFEGVLTNTAALLAAGGVQVRMELDPATYRVAVLDSSGHALALTTNQGAAAGANGLAEVLNYGYWLVGAQNSDALSAGTVGWAEAMLGIADQADPFSMGGADRQDDALNLRADGFFDATYVISRTTNLAEPFVPVVTGRVGTTPSIACTTDVSTLSGAFYRMQME